MSRVNRSWCFTYNNYTAETVQILQDITEEKDGIKFLIFQREISITRTPHLQGYVEYSTPQRMAGGIRKLGIGSKVHFEQRKGTREQAIAYCEKADSADGSDGAYIYGKRGGGRGKRSDLDAVAKSVQSGDDLSVLYDRHPVEMIKFERGIKAMMGFYSKKRKMDDPPTVEIYYGKTGTGKTRKVYDDYDLDEIYQVPKPTANGPLWFDGYTGEKVMLFDDYYSWISYDVLLKILDRYPMRLPIKGGFTMMQSTVFIFTSNMDPEKWHKKIPKHDALKRRVTKVLCFTGVPETGIVDETLLYKGTP